MRIVNDARQRDLNGAGVEASLPDRSSGLKKGGTMTTISLVSTPAAGQGGADSSLKSIVLFCVFGLLVSANLIALGVDLGAGWM